MRALAAAVVLSSTAAGAWPVDVIVDVEKGSEKFQKLAAVDWFVVEDPAVAEVEWLESGELLVSGKAPGRTLVLFYAQGTAAVWRIRVSEKGAPPKPVNSPQLVEAAKKACPGLVAAATLSGTVKTEGCRKALLALLETDAYRVADLDLLFEEPVMQGQVQATQGALRQLVSKARFSFTVPGGLVLEGPLTPPEHKRVLWEIFRRLVGRLALNERLEPDEAPKPP